MTHYSKEKAPHGGAVVSPYPHEISCDTCRRHSICNHCGGSVDRRKVCTNGRCVPCCSAQCKHVTQ